MPYQAVQERDDIKQFFGEKYGDVVRVIDIDFSKELCGGTHIDRAGSIGLFRILKEGSIAAGVRRIEAATGHAAELYCRDQEKLLENLSQALKTTALKLSEKLSQLIFDHKNLLEHNHVLSQSRNLQVIEQLIANKEEVGPFSLICKHLDLPKQDLRDFALQLSKKSKGTISVLAAHEGDSVALVVALSDDLKKEKLSAKDILQAIVEPIQGKGGGKELFAQAGGTSLFSLILLFTKSSI